jgi:hypothetical protein
MNTFPLISLILAPFSRSGRPFSPHLRKNQYYCFRDPTFLLSVQLSGAILQLEITANSTYWEAKLRSDGLGVAEWGKKGKKEVMYRELV